MPSVSTKQARTMRAAAHDKKFANKMGIPQQTARHYVDADKKKRMAKALVKKPSKSMGY